MKILVTVKQIINRDNGDSELNANDLNAVELALSIKDKLKDCKVSIISMGTMQAQKVIRSYLALGADEGIIVTDRQFEGSDTLATSETISKAVNYESGYNLIICGAHSADAGTGQVGPKLAEKLNLPQITNVKELVQIDEEFISCKRKVEDYFITEQVKLPAVITVLEGINEPRTKTLRGVMMATKKEIQVLTNSELMIPENRCGAAGSATKVNKVENEKVATKGNFVSIDEENINQVYECILG
ncbi:electron transfer flavoprotein subunit beta/FixA family protein [Clostridium felsineum]|uniref:electron transfer flavoprotein subunit beta/FixA family protein n=1 Tax=Clostridium felsineum TaxID=36839 RepID=UPI0009D291F8|nr:electron transfer flavoprotein subunit beta/FixA family protein [Clostridium felsineum]URZ03202.1 Caffeyl-CoA reductase-Etf complex subunit CarD [Clostridium felsineum]